MRFSCSIVPAADDAHVYQLHGEINAEGALTNGTPVEQLTKMALARLLQRNQELLADETLQTAWNKSWLTLRDSVGHLLPAVPAEHGRGKGRGKGVLAGPAGKGRGRGQRPGQGKGPGKGKA